MKKFGLSLTLLAGGIFGIPYLVVMKINFLWGIVAGLVGAVAWIVLMNEGIRRHGTRFCWFLLTAPQGLFWPLLLVRWLYGSSQGDPNWMAP